jgi:putative transcriptional regulator
MTKGSELGDELIESLEQATRHARGQSVDARVTEVAVPAVRVREIRQKVGLSQAKFAPLLGVSVSGLRKWEQGARRPGGAALTLLQVMDRNPQAVVDALETVAQNTKVS